MRFRSGTLERSIKRWGPRFPTRGKLQRVSHTWKYVRLDEENVNRTTGATTQVVLVDNDDWNVAGGANSVRNVTLDLKATLTWSPGTTVNGLDQWGFLAGVFCVDTEDADDTVSELFASHRALWWDATARGSTEQAFTSGGPDGQARQISMRIKKRQRFMKFEDELRFACAFTGAVDSTITDARLWIFGRVSWETP